MIYSYTDFIEPLSKLHPEVEIKSLELILKRGLQGINRIMRSEKELLVHNFCNKDTREEWIKFFVNMSPQEQNVSALKSYYKKQRKKELDGRTEQT
jgi:hypothetical protein